MLTDKLLLILIVAFLLNKVVLNRPPMQLDVPEPAAHTERFGSSLLLAQRVPLPSQTNSPPGTPCSAVSISAAVPPRVGHRQILP